MAEINYLDLLLQDLQDNSGMRKPAGAYDNMPFSASKFEKDLLSTQPIANLAFNSAYPGQAPIQIEAAAPELPVESPAPGVGTYSKIMNPTIAQKTEELNKARDAYGQMFQAYKEEEQPYEAALKKLSQPIPEYKPSMDFSGELGRLLKESAGAKEPQQNDLAQAILTLGPALASFGGEAGALAAPKIAATSKEAYDASIKTMQTSNEAKRKAIANQIEALAKLQANDVVQFSEKQKTELSRLQAELAAQKGKVDINRASLKDSSTHLNKLSTDLDALTEKAAGKVSTGEEKFGAAENLEKAKVAAAERKAVVDKELEALKQKSTLSLEDKKQQKALELEAEKLKGQLKLEDLKQKGREKIQKMKPVKGGGGGADLKDVRFVNEAFNQQMKEPLNRLDGARRVMTLIESIENGTIKDYKTIRNTLTSDLLVLTLPTGMRGTQRGMTQNAIDNIQTLVTDKLNKYSIGGQLFGTIPKNILDQLKKEAKILYTNYGEDARNRLNGLKAQDKNQNRQQMLEDRWGETFSKGHSLDPNTGKFIGEKSAPQIKVIGGKTYKKVQGGWEQQ